MPQANDSILTEPGKCLRVVYHGPGMAGKTANLEAVARLLDDGQRRLQRLVPLGGADPMLEFLACDASELGLQSDIRLQLMSVPGKYEFTQARRLLVQQADAVVFVADSRQARLDADILLLDELGFHLSALQRFPRSLPLVLQYNHADGASALSVEQLDHELNRHAGPSLQALARDGKGVIETLALVCGIDPILPPH